jgi:hypothetical protein
MGAQLLHQVRFHLSPSKKIPSLLPKDGSDPWNSVCFLLFPSLACFVDHLVWWVLTRACHCPRSCQNNWKRKTQGRFGPANVWCRSFPFFFGFSGTFLTDAFFSSFSYFSSCGGSPFYGGALLAEEGPISESLLSLSESGTTITFLVFWSLACLVFLGCHPHQCGPRPSRPGPQEGSQTGRSRGTSWQLHIP